MRILLISLTVLLGLSKAQGQSQTDGKKDSQVITSRLVSETTLDTDRFLGADELGNLFYMQDQVLYRKSGSRTFSFSNFDLGRISQVDVTNPFKILLFYKEFNSVIILDNNLNELSERIDFTQETLFNNVLFVANSSQNNLWLYADDNKLHLYNYRLLSEEVQTQALTFYEEDFKARGLVGTFKNVWIQSATEVLRFNEYGNYVETYSIEGVDRIFPFLKGLICLQDGDFTYRTVQQSRPIELPHKGLVEGICVSGSSLFIYDGNKVLQYELSL
jgi:hypothetical protein